MGNFRDNGRDRTPARRLGTTGRRRKTMFDMERLECRTLLAVPGSSAPAWVPTSSNLTDAQHGPLAKGGTDIVTLYQEYLAYEASRIQAGPFTSPLASQIEISGTNVGVDLSVYGSITTYTSSVKADGFIFQNSDTATGLVEGLLPISALPAVAEMPTTVGIQPIFYPVNKSVGKAYNEAEPVLGIDPVVAQYNLTGAGQTIGVLSDSVNQYPTSGAGLAASVATGDLPNNVQVLQDGAAGGTDEGRAMLEEIHDLAAGANLQFATDEGGDVSAAANIRALAAAGSTVEVDDFGYPDEPFYQDGVISDAVNAVAAAGVTYSSAAGNSADSGYNSNFRAGTGTVTGVGAGTFQNFNPNGGTALTLGINVYDPSTVIMQFDDPSYTTNGVVSNVHIFILDANNNVVASGTNNTIATQSPIQITGELQPGLYKVAIQVVSGPAPSHVAFFDAGDGGFAVDHQYGSAGGTTYPTIYGHPAAEGAIAVGATPWFNDPPYYSAATYYNEPYSDTGPNLLVFNPDGTRLAQPETLLTPQVTAPDAVDTSFFIPGFFISTLNPPNPQAAFPPYPGEPNTVTGNFPTPTELDGNANPNFTGTSAAAPQIAALAALMRHTAPRPRTRRSSRRWSNRPSPWTGPRRANGAARAATGSRRPAPRWRSSRNCRSSRSSRPRARRSRPRRPASSSPSTRPSARRA